MGKREVFTLLFFREKEIDMIQTTQNTYKKMAKNGNPTSWARIFPLVSRLHRSSQVSMETVALWFEKPLPLAHEEAQHLIRIMSAYPWKIAPVMDGEHPIVNTYLISSSRKAWQVTLRNSTPPAIAKIERVDVEQAEQTAAA